MAEFNGFVRYKLFADRLVLIRATEGSIMLKPLADRVIVKRIEKEATTASGIVLPETAKEKPEEGEVIEVGKDVKEVKKGDKVVFSKYGPTEIKQKGEELLIIKEEDILAILER